MRHIFSDKSCPSKLHVKVDKSTPRHLNKRKSQRKMMCCCGVGISWPSTYKLRKNEIRKCKLKKCFHFFCSFCFDTKQMFLNKQFGYLQVSRLLFQLFFCASNGPLSRLPRFHAIEPCIDFLTFDLKMPVIHCQLLQLIFARMDFIAGVFPMSS